MSRKRSSSSREKLKNPKPREYSDFRRRQLQIQERPDALYALRAGWQARCLCQHITEQGVTATLWKRHPQAILATPPLPSAWGVARLCAGVSEPSGGERVALLIRERPAP